MSKKTGFIKFTSFLAALFFAVQASAEERNILQRVFFDDFGRAAGAVAAEPVKTALISAAAISAGLVLYNNDRMLIDEMQRDKSSLKDNILDITNYFGDGIYVLAANSLLFLGGEKEKRTAERVMESFAVTGIVNYAMKTAFGRVRPSSGDSPYEFRPFSFSNLSFPSGHATVAFSWAVIIGDNYDIGYITYPLAALCAASRVYLNAHWPSDVFAGAVISTVIAKAINSQDEDSAFALDYKYGADSAMAGVKYRFN